MLYSSLFALWISAITTMMMVHGAPIAAPLKARQEPTGPVTNLTTVTSSTTSMGVITETCEVVLTPIVVNGEPAFEEVRSCVITMDTSNNGGAGGGAAGEDQTPPPPAESSGGEAPPPAESPGAEVPPPAESSGAEVPPPAESSGAEAPPAASSGSPLETFGVSEVPLPSASAPPTGDAPSSDPAAPAPTESTPTESGASPVETFGVSSVPIDPQSTDGGAAPSDPASAPPTASDTPASPDGEAAPPADDTQSSDTSGATAAAASEAPKEPEKFEVPGKEFSVLPIGLGVFAGISVIALIVVGLVMYERTKYRKAFRQRKLAEQGSALGYGGMAQRA